MDTRKLADRTDHVEPRDSAPLSPRDQRKLGRVAVVVWRFLVAFGAERQRWELRALARRVVDPRTREPVAERTLDRALARLEAAGLLRRQRRRVEHLAFGTWDHAALRFARPRRQRGSGWSSTLDLWVLGRVEHARLIVPIATIEWCAAQPGHGGHRRGVRRDHIKMALETSAPTTIATSRRDVTDQDGAPITPEKGVRTRSLSSRENTAATVEPVAGALLSSRGEGEPSTAPHPTPPATSSRPSTSAPTLAEVYAAQARYLARYGKDVTAPP